MKNGIPLPPRFREQSVVHSIEFPKPDRRVNPFCQQRASSFKKVNGKKIATKGRTTVVWNTNPCFPNDNTILNVVMEF